MGNPLGHSSRTRRRRPCALRHPAPVPLAADRHATGQGPGCRAQVGRRDRRSRASTRKWRRGAGPLMRTLDRALTSLSPLALLGILVAIDVAIVLVGWTLYGLPTWPDITPPRLLNLLTGEPLIRLVGDDISISNSLLTMWIVMAILLLLAYAGTRRLSPVPAGLQGGLEVAVQTLVDFVVDTGGPAAAKYVPLVGTLFLFILLCNWLGVVPLVGQIPLLHAPTADYHITLGLAIVAFVGYQAEGIRTLGRGYFKRWLNLESLKEGPFLGGLLIFVGFIEFLAEIIGILTLTVRLWGYIFG